MKTRFRRSAPVVESLEGRQLLSTTAVRPPATPYVDTQTPSSGGILAQLEAVEAQVGLLDARTSALETRTTALESRVTALEAQPDPTPAIASLQATVATQAAQIATLQDQVAALQANVQSSPIVTHSYHVAFADGATTAIKVVDSDQSRFALKITVHGGPNGGTFFVGSATDRDRDNIVATINGTNGGDINAKIDSNGQITYQNLYPSNQNPAYITVASNPNFWTDGSRAEILARGDAGISIDIQTYSFA